jgi:hypothetical protein
MDRPIVQLDYRRATDPCQGIGLISPARDSAGRFEAGRESGGGR